MPAKPSERQYRSLAVPLNVRAADGATKKRFDTEYYVEGYASTFNDPYVLFEDFDGTKYIEVISPDAFREADMSDVILQFDHAGRVYARMSNGTLIVEPDEHGLFIAADLSRSQGARSLRRDKGRSYHAHVMGFHCSGRRIRPRDAYHDHYARQKGFRRVRRQPSG